MNQYRFNFFFFILFSKLNEIKLEGLIDIYTQINLSQYSEFKRKFPANYSEEEDDSEEPSDKRKKNDNN